MTDDGIRGTDRDPFDPTLDELVAALPERYQPIFGHETEQVSRPADLDRNAALMAVIDAIGSEVGRPLRILDLGSAQGYFCFLAAERGHRATGIDFHPSNIALSRAIAARYPDLDVEFEEGTIQDAIATTSANEYDVVLGLSILHHVAHGSGAESATDVVRTCADLIPFGVFEMAVADEPMYWASAQPADPRVILSPYPFIRTIAHSSTHLSDIRRPMFYCSTTHALVNGQLVRWFDFSEYSHSAGKHAVAGKRRYFRTGDLMIKISAQFAEGVDRDTLEDMKDELRREASVLSSAPASLEFPTLVEFNTLDEEVVVARKSLTGARLDTLLGDIDLDRLTIFGQVLRQLAALEAAGLYHNDLRTWNILWDNATRTARLIDFGQLLPNPTDVAWPFDARYSLMLLAMAMFAEVSDETGLEVPRVAATGIDGLPSPVRDVVRQVLADQDESGTFERALHRYESSGDGVVRPSTFAERWLFTISTEFNREVHARQIDLAREHEASLHNAQMALALEADRNTMSDELARVETSLADLTSKLSERHADTERLGAEVRTRDGMIAELHRQLDDVRLQRDNAEHLAVQEAERRAAIERSTSWRLTSPLRTLTDAVRVRRRSRRQ